MTLSNDAKAVVAMTTRLGSSQRPSLTPIRWHRLAQALDDSGKTPADLFDADLDISRLSGVDNELAHDVTRLLDDASTVLLEADELTRRGIWLITVTDLGYPTALRDRLGRHTPPVLFGAGAAALLHQPGVGVVGSREVEDEGAEVARAIAAEAVRLGRPVVSGGARGVDQLAMNAAFDSGGSVVGVLADSLLEKVKRPEIISALDTGNICLVTQQAPKTGFNAGAAMNRNKLIYALSQVTVVVASAVESGGTWKGAVEALKVQNGLVTVWRGPGKGPGNVELEGLGAVPLHRSEDLGQLLEHRATTGGEQLPLL